MAIEFTTSYVKDATERFRYYKRQAERALAQIPDEDLFTSLSPRSNSIAVLVKHLSGNMRSRWTNFLTSDGEKSDRNYDAEFEVPPKTRAELLALWESGWKCAFDALKSLTDDHLTQAVYIRAEPHSVVQAVNRQMTHATYHVGQIIYLAKHFAGADWKSLTAPHGKLRESVTKTGDS